MVDAPATNLKRPMPASSKRGPNFPGLPTGAIPSRAPLSSLNVIHQRQLAAGGERAHFGEGATIEHARDGVARGDHDQPDRAGFKVAAIVAGSIRRDRSAGDRGQRAIEGAHDRANSNLVRGTGERIAAALALLRVNEAGVAQLCQNVIEKL